MTYVVHPKNISFVRDTMLDLTDVFTFLDPMKDLWMEGDLKTLISIFISESLEYNQNAENMDTIALLVRYMTENLKENYDLIKNKQPFKIYFGIRPEDIHHHVDNNKDYQKAKITS